MPTPGAVFAAATKKAGHLTVPGQSVKRLSGSRYLNSFDLSTRSLCARLKQVQLLVVLS